MKKRRIYSRYSHIRRAEKKIIYFILGSQKGAKILFKENYTAKVEPFKKAILDECDSSKLNIADAAITLFEAAKDSVSKMLHLAALGDILLADFKG